MRTGTVFLLVLGLCALLAAPAQVIGQQVTTDHEYTRNTDQEYTLNFIPTQNAPQAGAVPASGVMTLKVVNGETIVHFSVSGAYPNTVYTIWTVFNELVCPDCGDGIEVPSLPASRRPGFPVEGNAVSPLARLNDGFTSGMGTDPGASFATDATGAGQVTITLDYNLLRGAPVSNKDVIVQCVPRPGSDLVIDPITGKPNVVCRDPSSRMLRVTTTWLRRFIGEFPLPTRAGMCANYDPRFDPDAVVFDPVTSMGMDARFWQCITSSTGHHSGIGLPMVHRFAFDHFRLANHPDDLTHGFIGGNATDHHIDMVGRRGDLDPKPADCP